MKRLLSLLVLALLSAPAAAQTTTWYARGEFNGWNTANPMTDLGGGHYQTTITGLFDNQNFQYKVACCGADSWGTAMPGGNGVVTSNAAGEITLNMYDQTTWTDGWLPNNARRVGYADPLEYGWDLMGSFDGWTTGLSLVNKGNGLYSVQAPFNAGFYDFKFRKAGDWAVNTAYDFTNGPTNNNQFAVATSGDMWQFDLDLPNGRWRAFSIDQHGDFNGDGNTDAADYAYLRKNYAGNAAKYTEWRTNFGRTTALSWIAHGTFGNDVTLASQGGGNYTAALTGMTPGQSYDVQVLRSDASSHWPGSPAKITADASGNINLKYYELQGASWNDGWSPDTFNRVGYTDPHQFGWEVVGDFNGWPAGAATGYSLTDNGNGDYTGSFAIATAGAYQFKFRKIGDWGTSTGDDFGNSAANASFTSAADGDIWNFELDLPHGRWRVYHPTLGSGTSVPEPGSCVLLLLCLAMGAQSFRRR